MVLLPKFQFGSGYSPSVHALRSADDAKIKNPMSKYKGLYRPKYRDRLGNAQISAVYWMSFRCSGCPNHPYGGEVHRESTGERSVTFALKRLKAAREMYKRETIRGLYRPKFRTREGQIRQSSIYWIAFSCRGCPKHPSGSGLHRESTHERSLQEAKAILDRARGMCAEGKAYVPIHRIRMSELLTGVLRDAELYRKRSTVATYKDILARHLMPYFGRYRAVDLCYNEEIVRSFIIEKSSSYKESTINGMLALLKKAFSLAKNRMNTQPIIKKLRINNTRTTYFTQEEFFSLCSHLPQEIVRPLRVMFITGWRSWSEVFSRERRHVDWQAGRLILEAGEAKNSEPRFFPLLPGSEVRTILEEQEKATTAYEQWFGVRISSLFHHDGMPLARYYGNRDCWKPTRYFLKHWQAALNAAGLSGRWRHDFRRTAIRAFAEKGIPDEIGMKLSGHKTSWVYGKYKAIGDVDIFREAQKLDRALKGSSEKDR